MSAPAFPRGPVAPLEPLSDSQIAADWSGFALRSLQRHRRRALGVFLAVAASSVAGTMLMPRTYHVECKLLAQHNLLIPTLSNPGRAIPSEADSPTMGANEAVLRRDNLEKVVRQTDAVVKWEAQRGIFVRAKDAVMRAIRGAPSQADREDALVGMLEKRITVATTDRTVSISVDWPNAQLAYELADTLQQDFLESRRDTQVASIEESIQILQAHADREKANVDAALEAYRQAQSSSGRLKAPVAPPPAPEEDDPAPRRVHSARSGALEALQALKTQLDVKRHALAALEEDRQRNLADLQRKLTEARATYGPAHPVIVSLTQSIDRLEREPAEVASLRQDVQQLEAQVRARAGELPAPPPRAKARAEPATTADVLGSSLSGLAPLTASEDLANERLRAVQMKYSELLGRIESARIELDTAQAGFKFRYAVITPPELPRKATHPNVPLSIVAGLLFAAALGFGSAVAADLRRGRLVESWQVERRLNLPVLSEVELP